MYFASGIYRLGRTDQVIAAASLGGNGNIALVLNEFGTRAYCGAGRGRSVDL